MPPGRRAQFKLVAAVLWDNDDGDAVCIFTRGNGEKLREDLGSVNAYNAENKLNEFGIDSFGP